MDFGIPDTRQNPFPSSFPVVPPHLRETVSKVAEVWKGGHVTLVPFPFTPQSQPLTSSQLRPASGSGIGLNSICHLPNSHHQPFLPVSLQKPPQLSRPLCFSANTIIHDLKSDHRSSFSSL